MFQINFEEHVQESPEPITNTLMMLTISNAINVESRLVAKDIVQQFDKWKTSPFSFGCCLYNKLCYFKKNK